MYFYWSFNTCNPFLFDPFLLGSSLWGYREQWNDVWYFHFLKWTAFGYRKDTPCLWLRSHAWILTEVSSPALETHVSDRLIFFLLHHVCKTHKLFYKPFYGFSQEYYQRGNIIVQSTLGFVGGPNDRRLTARKKGGNKLRKMPLWKHTLWKSTHDKVKRSGMRTACTWQFSLTCNKHHPDYRSLPDREQW